MRDINTKIIQNVIVAITKNTLFLYNEHYDSTRKNILFNYQAFKYLDRIISKVTKTQIKNKKKNQ